MEELRSTEILDKEILADARKKAERLLVRAEAEGNRLLAAVDGQAAQAEAECAARLSADMSALRKDKEAALPLEKERFLVSFVQESIERALNAYFLSVSEKERLLLALQRLEKSEDMLRSQKVRVYFYGFDRSSVKEQLDSRLTVTQYEETEFNKFIPEADGGLDKKEGIIVEAEDGSVRLRLTIPELAHTVLNAYRAELYAALFGGRLENV